MTDRQTVVREIGRLSLSIDLQEYQVTNRQTIRLTDRLDRKENRHTSTFNSHKLKTSNVLEKINPHSASVQHSLTVYQTNLLTDRQYNHVVD